MSAIDHFWAVVPAGGAGTRLWPLSRSGAPKFLHDLTGTGRTLLQGTWDRLVPLSEDRFLVVTGRKHRAAVLDQLPEADPARVLAEPSPRDSMAAIGLAAALLERADPEAVMGSFAADHVIPDAAAFADVLRIAVDVAREDWLVTLGIEPAFPSAAFGYIRLGDALAGHPGAHAVAAFVEKPSVRTATDYLATGRYRWNAGMFVVRPTVLLDLLGEWHPEFAAALRRIAADPDALEERLAAEWADLPRIAVDHAVAEPAADAGRVACVPAAFGWEDVGDFDSLASLLAGGAAGETDGGGAAAATTTVLGAEALVRAIDSTGLVVPAGGRVVAVVGLEDVVVVDTPDALLVTTRARAQDVKQVVAELKESGREHLT